MPEVRPRLSPALPRAASPQRRRALELPPLRLRRGHQARGRAPAGPAGAGDAADEVGAAVRARGPGLGPPAPAQPPALLLLLRRARTLEPEDAAVLPLLAVVPRGLHPVPLQAAALRRQVLRLRVQRLPGGSRERAEAAPALGGRGSPPALPPQRLLQEEIFRFGAGNSPLRQFQLGRAAARPAFGHAEVGAARAPPGGPEQPQGQVRVGPGDEEAQGALRAPHPRPSPTAPGAAAGPPLPPRPLPHPQPLPRAGEGRGSPAPLPPRLPGPPRRLLQLQEDPGPEPPQPPHPDVRLLPPLGQHQPQLSHAGPGPRPSPRAPPAPPPSRAPLPHLGPAPFGPAPLGPAPPGPGAARDAGRDRSVPAGVGGRGHALTPPPPPQKHFGDPCPPHPPPQNFWGRGPKKPRNFGLKMFIFVTSGEEPREGAGPRKGAGPEVATPIKMFGDFPGKFWGFRLQKNPKNFGIKMFIFIISQRI